VSRIFLSHSSIFLSHSSRNTPQAITIKQWLVEQEPGLADEIFLDLDPVTGIQPGERWKEALRRPNVRCEAEICLLSRNWKASVECRTEFRTAESLNKPHSVRTAGASCSERYHRGTVCQADAEPQP
jgi:hypothetical protein